MDEVWKNNPRLDGSPEKLIPQHFIIKLINKSNCRTIRFRISSNFLITSRLIISALIVLLHGFQLFVCSFGAALR